jgi:hypothetical protein
MTAARRDETAESLDYKRPRSVLRSRRYASVKSPLAGGGGKFTFSTSRM